MNKDGCLTIQPNMFDSNMTHRQCNRIYNMEELLIMQNHKICQRQKIDISIALYLPEYCNHALQSVQHYHTCPPKPAYSMKLVTHQIHLYRKLKSAS